MDKKWIASLILASGVAVGCDSTNDDDVYPDQNMPDSQSLTDPYGNVYSPIKGDTTGSGQPRDLRTGGAITGNDVTPREKLEKSTRENTPPPTDDRPRSDPGPGIPTGPDPSPPTPR